MAKTLYVFSYGIWEFHFGPLVFALYFNCGICIAEIKIKIRTYFKSLVSNNTRTWWSKRRQIFIENLAFQFSHGTKIIYWSKLYQYHTHWKKGFSQLLYFWRFVSRFFSDRVEKFVLCESSLDFQRREDQINIVCEKPIYFAIFR